jgi:hypothetical protein
MVPGVVRRVPLSRRKAFNSPIFEEMFLFPVQHTIQPGGEIFRGERKEYHKRKVRRAVGCVRCVLSDRDRVTSHKCLRSKRSSKTLANQSLLLQNQRSVPLVLAVPHPPLTFGQYIDPIIAATWSEDGAIHDVCKALAPRFREPNSIVSCSSPLVSRRTHRWADTSSGGVQGAHRSPYHDSERRNRQCTSVSVFFGGFTVKERRRWSMGRYVLYPSPYSIIPLSQLTPSF